MKRWACAVALALLLAPAAGAADTAPPSHRAATATTAAAPARRPLGQRRRSAEEPFAPAPEAPADEGASPSPTSSRYPKVAHWLERYPPKPQTDATFDKATRRWTVQVWSGRAGEIALGKVEDARRAGVGGVRRARRSRGGWRAGGSASFGGKVLNAWWMWIPLSVVFFLGLVDRRRIRSWHTARPARRCVSFGFSLLVLQPRARSS